LVFPLVSAYFHSFWLFRGSRQWCKQVREGEAYRWDATPKAYFRSFPSISTHFRHPACGSAGSSTGRQVNAAPVIKKLSRNANAPLKQAREQTKNPLNKLG